MILPLLLSGVNKLLTLRYMNIFPRPSTECCSAAVLQCCSVPAQHTRNCGACSSIPAACSRTTDISYLLHTTCSAALGRSSLIAEPAALQHCSTSLGYRVSTALWGGAAVTATARAYLTHKHRVDIYLALATYFSLIGFWNRN